MEIVIEYAVVSDEGVARYCATEFYSNHFLGSGPGALVVVRFSVEIAADACGLEDLRLAHPTKAIGRKAARERYLVESLVMTNDVEVKIFRYCDKDVFPDETVSANRIMDNPADFSSWVDMYCLEIGMQ